jgi:hypothetical protein
MSAVADFRLVETSRLNELSSKAEIKIEKKFFSKKVTDDYWEFLYANSKKLKDFNWSGYVFADLLEFLVEKKGIDLLKGKYEDIANSISEKRENATFILTYEHRQKYLDQLNPDIFSLDELIAFNKEFSEDDEVELAKAEMEGIRFLRDNLSLLTDDTKVVLLTVG